MIKVEKLSQIMIRWLRDDALRPRLLQLFTPNQRLEAYLKQVEHGKPIQYILRSQPFCGLDIITRSPVLIPRPETEQMTLYALHKLPTRPLRVLDLCCGSGCIGLSVKKHLPSARVTLVDIQPAALRLSALNSRKFGLDVELMKADLLGDLSEFDGRFFDVILSNPPYISDVEYANLDKSVVEWEDKAALVGVGESNSDGLKYYDKIIELIKKVSAVGAGNAVESYEKMGFYGVEDVSTASCDDRPLVLLETGGKAQVEALKVKFRAAFPSADLKILQDGFGVERFVQIR